jgi:MFS family permease
VRDLGATTAQLQWIVDAYTLVFAGMLLAAGSLGDRFGRKRALFSGMAIFALGSILASLSGSATRLILTRGVMGLGAALIMPSTLSILTNVFPPHERGRAIGIWAAMAGVGIPLGPVLGGILLERFSWGSILLVNLPIVALALASGYVLIPESSDRDASPIGVAAALLFVFVLWELRNRTPMLNMRLFRNPRFSAASLSIALVFFAMLGSFFLLTQYLQFVLGYSPLATGIRLAPAAAGVMIGAPLSSRIAERIGSKIPVAAGLAVAAGGLYLLSTLSVDSSYGLVLVAILTFSCGMGLAMTPATDSIMGAVPRSNAGVGSAMNDTNRQVGGAFGVAVLGSLLATDYRSALAPALQPLPPDLKRAAAQSVGAAVEIGQRLGGQQGRALIEAADRAFVHGMGTAFVVAAAVAAGSSLLALLLLPAHASDGEEPHRDDAGA